MKITLTILAIAVMATAPGHVQGKESVPFSARDLYEACKHTIEKLDEGPDALSEPKKIQSCFFYVMGSADMAASMSPSSIYGGNICVPRGYAFQDVARKIVALGVEHPSLFNGDTPASLLAYYAVKESYGTAGSCPDSTASDSE